MTNNISRRTIVKGAAWSVPVIAVAVATPLAAASQTPITTRLDWNTHDAWSLNDYAATTRIGANIGVKTLDGSPVPGVVLAIKAVWPGGEATKTFTSQINNGWGSTPDFATEFPGVPKGVQVVVTFTASAPGAETIFFTKKINTNK